VPGVHCAEKARRYTAAERDISREKTLLYLRAQNACIRAA
jgi:hypothetical protein